jgi:hypothetical protein
VNLPFHDEFVALVPLFYSGELTDEEWALLQVHMAYCDSCQEAFEQYQHIAVDVIPAMAASAAAEVPNTHRESDHALREAEQRLMSQLGTHSVLHRQSGYRIPWGRIYIGAAAACLIGGLVFAVARYTRTSPSTQPLSPVASIATSHPLVPAVPVPKSPDDHEALTRDDQRISSLQDQLSGAEKKFAESRVAAADAKDLLQNEEAQQQQLTAQRDNLAQQLAAAQAEAQSLQGKLTAVESNTGQRTTRVTDLQARVDYLNAALGDANTSLESKEKLLTFDKELMMHDRDVRNVIGARNLYIADIYDTKANGSTAKPFGRIFYTKNQSLVFYGFDLDKQPGIKRNVAFQVWGGSADKRPVSLGLFYQDDNHNRWILKCNDAATLARLNSVFVTVEPPGGSRKPTGVRLLRAYLQIQPNHP